MGTGAFYVNFNLEAALFADAENVGEGAGGLDGGAAALVDGERGGQLVGVVVGEPAEAVASAVLLVGAGGQDQAVPEGMLLRLMRPHGHDLGGQQSLAVGRAAPVYAAIVRSVALKGERPLLFLLHGHHVGVGHEHESGFARPVPPPGQ